MPNYRKSIREAVHTALADVSTGFNPRLAALAVGGAYAFVPFAIDWSIPSDNFLMSYITPQTAI